MQISTKCCCSPKKETQYEDNTVYCAECGETHTNVPIKETPEYIELQHEYALLINTTLPKKWCCRYASSSNGWHHNTDCKDFV